MEAYIHATGSFISTNYNVTKARHAIEEPLENPNLGPDWQLQKCTSEIPKGLCPHFCIVRFQFPTVGLIKFTEGNFKKLPQLGDTFFKLEKVSEELAGNKSVQGCHLHQFCVTVLLLYRSIVSVPLLSNKLFFCMTKTMKWKCTSEI